MYINKDFYRILRYHMVQYLLALINRLNYIQDQFTNYSSHNIKALAEIIVSILNLIVQKLILTKKG